MAVPPRDRRCRRKPPGGNRGPISDLSSLRCLWEIQVEMSSWWVGLKLGEVRIRNVDLVLRDIGAWSKWWTQ